MAAIQKADEISDDARTELRSLTESYEGAEVELRASLLLEGAERDKIKEPDKASTDFDRECRSFQIGSLVAALTEGKALSGREAEVSQELENRDGTAQKGVRFPWEALERRDDVPVTGVAGSSGNLASRPTMNALERFFEVSAAGRFGVNALQVTGAPSFPEITGGTGISWVAEGAGADAAAITTTTKNPVIKTATGRYLLTRQSVKQNSALEPVLRRDLSETLREGIDLAVFQGTGADDQPAGFETVLTGGRTDALDAEAGYELLVPFMIQLMETAKINNLQTVRMAGAPIVLQTLLLQVMTGTSVSQFEMLKKFSADLLFSSQVSTWGARDATDKGASTVYFGAGDNNAFVPTWGSPELLVDPYSESKTGKIALTMFAFVDVLIQRTGSHWFKLTDVLDRA